MIQHDLIFWAPAELCPSCTVVFGATSDALAVKLEVLPGLWRQPRAFNGNLGGSCRKSVLGDGGKQRMGHGS